MAISKPSLSDAEVLEDVSQHLVRLDGAAHNLAQVVEAFAQVLAHEVAREARSQPFLHAADGRQGAGQRLVVAHVAHHHVRLRQVGQGGEGHQPLLEVGQPVPPLGREGHDEGIFRQPLEGGGTAAGRQEVGLVEHQHEVLALAAGQDVGAQLAVLLAGAGGVDDPQDDVRLLQLLEAPLDAQALDGVGGLADAGRVDEAEGDAAQVQGVLDDVARGAVDVAHDGAFLAHQGVEQGGLARVRLAHDGHGDAVLQGVAHAERVRQAGDNLLHAGGDGLELRAVGKLQVLVVAEVQLQLHERGEMQELVAQLGQLAAEASAHLVHGHAVGGGRGRGDEVGHGFGLAQVHLSVEEGALGVFARPCGAAPLADEQLHHLLEDVGRAVAGYLHRVLARVRMGCAEEADQHFVHHFARGREDLAEGQGVGGPFRQGLARSGCEEAAGDGDGVGARHADDADGSAWGGGDGADGILVHFFPVFGSKGTLNFYLCGRVSTTK